MKNFIKIMFVGSLIVLGACKDYLETDQITDITQGNYYSTQEEAYTALIGCYDGLQRIWNGGVALPVAAVVASDLAFGGTGSGDDDIYPMIDEYDKAREAGEQSIFETNWKKYYAGIFRCNTLLVNMKSAEWAADNPEAKVIEAEARFIRALMYFDLVRMFERIPLLDEPTIENVPQATPQDTYQLITEDLLFAIENARDTPYGSIPSTDHGHAYKWAAESLLARVYLYYTGYYGESDLVGLVTQSQALGYLEDVISQSGYDLVENFADLWPAAATYEAAMRGDSIADNTYAGETNKEVIFAIKYTYTSLYDGETDYDGSADGNHWLVMNGLRNQSWGQYGYANGWGAATVVPEFYDTWDPNDERRSASIMAIEEESINYEKIQDVKEYTGYFTKKYTPTADPNGNPIATEVYNAADFLIGQFQDYICIRFADVLLMAAELGSGNALFYLNRVRQRAGLGDAGAATKDVIYDERKYEFAFEGLRYWDLLRYDQSLDYAANAVSYNGTVLTANEEVTKVISGDNLKLTRGLFQIPNNQITLSSGLLSQNEGW